MKIPHWTEHSNEEISRVTKQERKEVFEELSKLNRLEIIEQGVKRHWNWNVKVLDFSLQDNGRTLKIFIKELSEVK